MCVGLCDCGGTSGGSSMTSGSSNGSAGSPGPSGNPTSPSSPSNPPAAKSAKRGVAYDLADPADLTALSPGVSWWYNWSFQPNASVPAGYATRYGMDFYPMLWNGNFNTATVVAFLKANPSIKYML